MSIELKTKNKEFKTPGFGDLMPNNGLAISMKPDFEEYIRIRILERKKKIKWRKIAKMLADGASPFDILDKIEEYADAKHEFLKAREEE